MSTLDTIVLNDVTYDLGGGGAELPYKNTEIALTTAKGRMTTGLTVFGTQYRYASFSVTSGQKYLITGWCSSASIPCAFTVDANNTATILLGTVNEVYEDAEITIPSDAVTLYINSKSDGEISAILQERRYTQAEFDEKIYKIDELSADVTNKADLTYEFTPVNITVADGWINTNLGTYTGTNQYHTSLAVNAGEVYGVTGGTRGGGTTYYPCAFVVDANNNVTVLCESAYAFNELITIPNGAVTLYVNNSAENLIGISSATRTTQAKYGERVKKSGNKVPNLKVLYNSNGVQIKRKYNAENDLVLTMGNFGPNSLFNFAKAQFVANTEDEPNDLFVGYTNIHSWTASSDCLGPYWVRAVNNIDGDYPTTTDFTGGNHTNTGGAITATQQSLSILINGLKEAQQNIIYSCEKVVIRWTNLIQGYNTSKADGTGRGIMTESWEAVIEGDRVKLTNKITALEDIVISRYYGFQFNTSGGRYYFVGGANRKVYTEAAGSGAGASGNNTCRKMVITPSNDLLTVEINVDPVDLGLFALNNGTSFFASNAKVYSDLIYDHELELASGEYAFLEGYYRFC